MADRVIPQRELRNNVGKILRDAEAGTEFTITVRGRPVAKLGPPGRGRRRRVNVPADVVHATFAETPVDDAFASDIAALRDLEAPTRNPWLDEQ